MMKGENGRNQRAIEKGFPALSTASQTAFHHQLCFCSPNEQMEQIERVKLQQCAVAMLLQWETHCYIEMEVKETEGGGQYRAWCNHLYKLNKCGKQQEVNYDIMPCKLCNLQFELLYSRTSLVLFVMQQMSLSPLSQVFY